MGKKGRKRTWTQCEASEVTHQCIDEYVYSAALENRREGVASRNQAVQAPSGGQRRYEQ